MDTWPQAMHRQAASWVGVVEAMLAFLLTLITCHPERSEGSCCMNKILLCAQDDNIYLRKNSSEVKHWRGFQNTFAPKRPPNGDLRVFCYFRPTPESSA